jgi:hypothetical protein
LLLIVQLMIVAVAPPIPYFTPLCTPAPSTAALPLTVELTIVSAPRL